MLEKLATIKAMYLPEIRSHSSRWHFPITPSLWEEDVKSDLEDYLIDRPCYVRRNLIAYFELLDFGFDCDPLNLTDAPDFLLSPNPNQGSFLLWNNYKYLENPTIKVYQLNGKLIYCQEFTDYQKTDKIAINMPEVSSGMYIVKIESLDFNSTKKMLVIR